MSMPLATASRRSRLISLRLRDDSEPRKSSKVAWPAVFPMELLVSTQQEALRLGERSFGLRHEGDVDGGGFAQTAKFAQPLQQSGANIVRVRRRLHQQARAGGRRERDRYLQLRVIASASVLIGFRPAAIEHVFAARVRLEVAGHDARQCVPSSRSAIRCWGCQPVRAGGRLGKLSRGQKLV